MTRMKSQSQHLVPELATLALCFVVISCTNKRMPENFESISEERLATNAFGLREYLRERVPIPSDQNMSLASSVLKSNGLAAVTIDAVDKSPDGSELLIRTHQGQGFFTNARLYLFEMRSNVLKDLAQFARRDVESASILGGGNTNGPLIVLEMKPPNQQWWVRELWTNHLGLGLESRLTIGGRHQISPDHSKIAFWREDGSGYYTLHVWEHQTGQIRDVLGVWETDVGSGPSWTLAWSADSKAISIRGDCGGFQRDGSKGRRVFDLICLVTEQRVFTIPSTSQRYPEMFGRAQPKG